MTLDLTLDLTLIDPGSDPDRPGPRLALTGPKIDLKNPISEIYWFRGMFSCIKCFEFEASKDWIAAPT